MFENEAYKYLSTGQLEQIPHITAETLYHTYQSMINNDQCSVYVVGNVEPESVEKQIREKFALKPFDKHQFQHSTHHLHDEEVDYIVEYDDVDQAKLNMGYRFPTQYGQSGYAAFVVFNMMFGGDPSSVLFNEVREKQSLAYSIHSQIDGKNGYLFVLSGVTSFDRTSYLFSATDNIENNIKRLLTMVETPYFTKETVDKEKGIIAEEIKMYQEQPGYKLMFNTLRAMYQQHPIRVDIAGSVESIYDITKDDLYLCYETFYHPSNMVLFVVGDVDPEAICRIVKQHEDARNKVNQPKIERGLVNEPEDVKEAFVTESMKIQSPRLMLGFKNKPLQEAPQKYVQRDLEMSLFFELIFGEETDFYQNLLNEGLIDDTFGYQFVLEPTYSFSIVTSATEEPDKLKKLLLDELRDKKGNFQDAEAFELLKKQFIGEFISSLNSPEYIANQYTKLYFEGVSVFDMLDIVENITLDSINETSSLYLNLDQQVDSRLEIKK
ncbi:insulinase family protein [Staphylococcus aureus]|nr:insulinase family protein [Staphylococcus aureus]